MLAGAICFMSETYLSENQVFVSVDLKYKEHCLHVNRFQWLSSYMHNFVKKLLKIKTPPTVFELDLLYFVDSTYTEGVHILWILTFNIFLQNYGCMNLDRFC
jgi:hypothetical protein